MKKFTRYQLHPYMETKPFDTTLVFGAGPIKPLVTKKQLTAEQITIWEHYQTEAVFSEEPDFYISNDSSLQQNPVLVLNRWGKLNSLAAGWMLVSGLTKRLIITGGKTKPKWAAPLLSKKILSNWPSEAALMKKLIITQFDDIYTDTHKHPISDAILLEEQSTNTLENFVYTLNNHQELLFPSHRVALLTAEHHLRRATILAHLFSLWEAPFGQLSSQEVLRAKAQTEDNREYAEVLQYMRDAFINPNIGKLLKEQRRWETGLLDPNYISYWLGYIGEIRYPTIIQNVFHKLTSPLWIDAARRTCAMVDLDFDEYKTQDLEKLRQSDRAAYDHLLFQLCKLKQQPYRMIP